MADMARQYEAVVVGASAGGMHALKAVLCGLPADLPLAVAVVQHVEASSSGYLSEFLDDTCAIAVREAEEKEPFRKGTAYIAPANYHLLIEPDRTLSLSADDKVNYSRPAIDPLFESAADVFGQSLIGVVMTGASSDGALGLRRIKDRGGRTVVQNPATADSPFMPQAAVRAAAPDHILDLEDIAPLLVKLAALKRREVPHGRL
jgi:two-component system chemotaxis response regulator CheB